MKNDVIYVDADALRSVLVALNGPRPQVAASDIRCLVQNYNDAIARAKAAQETEAVTDVVDKVEYLNGEVTVIGVAGANSCLLNKSLPVGTKLYGKPTFNRDCYYAADGTLMNTDGTRSVFDDVDK